MWARSSEVTALEAAARNENVKLVQYLLSVGADADDPTALLAAVLHQNVGLVKILLAARANDEVSEETEYGVAALVAAV